MYATALATVVVSVVVFVVVVVLVIEVLVVLVVHVFDLQIVVIVIVLVMHPFQAQTAIFCSITCLQLQRWLTLRTSSWISWALVGAVLICRSWDSFAQRNACGCGCMIFRSVMGRSSGALA